MATISNNIETALSILNNYDWFWKMDGWSDSAERYQQKQMREFVALAKTCGEKVYSALRELWTITFQYYRWHITTKASEKETTTFNTRKAELLSIIGA